jgi:hypothetical protein
VYDKNHTIKHITEVKQKLRIKILLTINLENFHRLLCKITSKMALIQIPEGNHHFG